jgi:hypothetical protein
MQDSSGRYTTQNPKTVTRETPPNVSNWSRDAKRKEFDKRFTAVKATHLWWRGGFEQLSQWINPLRGVFDTPPQKRAILPDYRIILDDQATQASKTLASGMSSGMTSQSMPWLRLNIDGMEDMPNPSEIRGWLDSCQARLYEMLDKSNLYFCLNSCYEELGIFGTGCFIVLEDYEDFVRGTSFTIGEYYIACDNKGRVNTFCREFWMTVQQMVEEFGYENCSASVRQQWDWNLIDTLWKVRHMIEPNDVAMLDMPDFKNMPFRSAYWDMADGTNTFLGMRGFKRFPVICPRWETVVTDQPYGYGCGTYALGHVRELQKTTQDKLLTQEKTHNPPMQADGSVDGHVSTIPGGVTRTNSNAVPNAGVRPAYQIQANLGSFLELENALHDKIDKCFFVNLFLMLMNFDKNNMTAQEVAERQQEKIMMMGPILYRLQTELLDPLVSLLFGIAMDNKLFPPPPQQIAGLPIKVEYTSILAQAQKQLGVQQISRVVGFIQTVVQALGGQDTSIADGIDWDQTLREVCDMEGSPAKMNKDQVLIDQIRKQRAKAQQQQAQMQMAEQAANAAHKVGSIPTGPGTLHGAMTGHTQPAGAK